MTSGDDTDRPAKGQALSIREAALALNHLLLLMPELAAADAMVVLADLTSATDGEAEEHRSLALDYTAQVLGELLLLFPALSVSTVLAKVCSRLVVEQA